MSRPPSLDDTRPAAVSTLLQDLLGGGRVLREVARTRMSVHYETGDPAVPVLCAALPCAVRLPNSLLTPVLPRGAACLSGGALHSGGQRWQVTRWWDPSRPTGLRAPDSARLAGHGVRVLRDLDPLALVGAGGGLTPEGDDLLSAALVTARATADPRLEDWQAGTVAALQARRTTAVSHALLWHALDGWCIPQLADLLNTWCADPASGEQSAGEQSAGESAGESAERGDAVAVAVQRLLAVGHSSGRALLEGVVHTLTTAPARPTHYRCQGAA